MNAGNNDKRPRAVTFDEFMKMSRGERSMAIEQSSRLLRFYEENGRKPPASLVWGHYELLDAFG